MRLQSDVCLDCHHPKAWLDLEGLHWAPHVAAKILLAVGEALAPLWASPVGCLSIIRAQWLASLNVSHPREQDSSCNAFSAWAVEANHDSVWEDVAPRRQGSLAAILETGYHRQRGGSLQKQES